MAQNSYQNFMLLMWSLLKTLIERYLLGWLLHFLFFLKAGHGFVSKRHVLADVWLVKSDQVGASDAQTFSTKTHMGHVIHPGDLVLG